MSNLICHIPRMAERSNLDLVYFHKSLLNAPTYICVFQQIIPYLILFFLEN